MSDNKLSTYIPSQPLTVNGERVMGILDYGTWGAVATEAISVQSTYNLWFCVYDRSSEPVFAGTWVHSKAMVKYAKDFAYKKFPGMHPTNDTLSSLASITATCVVPACFEHGVYDAKSLKCHKCPYKVECFESKASGEAPTINELHGIVTITESDEEFHQRLQAKLAAKRWE